LGQRPEMNAVGAQLNVKGWAAEGDFSAKFEAGWIDFVDVAGGQGPNRGQRRVANDFGWIAFDTDVAGYGECREINGGDGVPFLIGDKGVAVEAISLLPGTG